MATLFKSIADYKRFLISPEVEEGVTPIVYDTLASWGLVAKTTPFSLLPKAKEPYINDWKDEDGQEAYVKSVHFEPYEIEVKFYIKAINGVGLYPSGDATNYVRDNILGFFNIIKEGYFSFYDEYTHIGRKKVRYVSYSEESFKSRDDWARCIFTIKLAVDDPTTSVYLTK